MNKHADLLPKEAVQALLEIIAPDTKLSIIRPIGGDFYNSSYIIEARTATDVQICFVLKCYAECGQDLSQKALLEFKILEWLQDHDLPAPRPVYLDEVGTFFGMPTLATYYLPGEQFLASPDAIHCAHALARTLAQIHSISCDEAARGFLLDANSETLWFLKPEGMPDYIRAHPDGPLIWQAVQEMRSICQPVPPTLIHTDYWLGNVLWNEGRIAAVLDWEEAACGDPGIDVAYCRMDLYLSGMGPLAADEFLKVYEAEMGRPVVNLAFWEFAAAPRPMYDPAWESEVRHELRHFIADTKQRAGY